MNVIDIAQYKSNIGGNNQPVMLLVFGVPYFDPFLNNDAQHVMRVRCTSQEEAFRVIDNYREDGFLMQQDGERLRLLPWPPAAMHMVPAEGEEATTP